MFSIPLTFCLIFFFIFVFVVYFLRDCFQSRKFETLWCFGWSSVLGTGEENCMTTDVPHVDVQLISPISATFLVPVLPYLLTLSPGLGNCSVRKVGFYLYRSFLLLFLRLRLSLLASSISLLLIPEVSESTSLTGTHSSPSLYSITYLYPLCNF